MQIVRGFALWACAVVLAWPMARFYGEPQLAWLIPVSSFSAVIAAFNSTSLFTENRKLALVRVTVLTMAAQVVSIVVMIAAAYMTGSVWSLVIGGHVNAAIIMASSHVVLPGVRNRLCWDRDSRVAMLSFGKWIFMSTMLTFLAMQLDRLVLGKLVPMEMLGVYSLAVLLVGFPQKVASRLSTTILYPVFVAHAHGQREGEFARKVIRARGAILPPCVVVFLILVLGAPPLFHYFYDPRYEAAGWMAQLLSIYVWFLLLQESVDRALLALGDSRAMMLSNAANVMATLAGCTAGFKFFGMPGFIFGLACSSLAGHLVTQWNLLRHRVNIVWQDLQFTAVAGGLAVAGVAGPALVAKMLGVEAGRLASWVLLVVLTGGAGVWAGLVVRRRVSK
jgi:O-antigen/teichoic acid export membrane protein